MEDNKIISFTDEKEVREMASNVAKEITNQKEETHSLFEDLANEMNNINSDLGNFQELGALLTLPDEQFKIVAPIFLDELARTFTNTNDTLALVQAMNINGVKLEDIREDFNNIVKSIDDLGAETDLMTEAKKDFLKGLVATSLNSISAVNGIEKRVLEVPVQLDNDAKLPTYAHLTDAGADVYAAEDMDIMPGEHKVLKTGVHLLVPKGYEVQVRMKSGIAAKSNLILKNGIGTIDEFYNGEIGIILANINPPIKDIEIDEDGRVKSILRGSVEHIEKGQKIAQILLAESPKMHFYEVEELLVPDGERGAGGYGSTGK